MGQDREYNQDQIDVVLRTVCEYRDRWEQVEKENLEEDIMLRLKSIAFDKEYKEHWEHADQIELEKQVDEGCAPKEGDDPMDEETKALLQRKLRFKTQTKGFYAPHEPKPPKKVKVNKDLHAPVHVAPQKTDPSPANKDQKSALGQQPTGAQQPGKPGEPVVDPNAHAQPDQPQYHPLKPEQWKKKLLIFKKYHVIKMPRVF